MREREIISERQTVEGGWEKGERSQKQRGLGSGDADRIGKLNNDRAWGWTKDLRFGRYKSQVPSRLDID